ncbi:hypothetical protein BG005_009829 [Podila minutissima]|nr:hypothetical protein BG005_009829 [Podila minutissima]
MAEIHKQKYSVLVLGKSQAGKTDLIQNIKTYANPSSTIDRSLLGDGTFSKADKTRHFRFKSNLPTYEAFDRESGTTHNLKNLEASTRDNEDCEDSLFARENTVGLRLKTQDSSKPFSRAMEFEFLDTPGFCNYKGKDVAHAESIIKAIVDARSFNLVLIVVNPLDPITADYQLALQYYSEVLYGLHTNIAFVFTHVDYALSRRSNSDGHLDLEETIRSLSRIFHHTSKDSHKSYPHFTLDLSAKVRPTIQYLNLETLRKILQLVVKNRAVSLETNKNNIARIKSLTHLTSLRSFYEGQQANIRSQGHAPDLSPRLPALSAKDEINILIIGDSGSGKTSLIDAMKQYASPMPVSELKLVAQLRTGAAEEIIPGVSFLSDLHTFEIRKRKGIKGLRTFMETFTETELIDVKEEAKAMSPKDFEALLHMDAGWVTARNIDNKLPKKYRFNLFRAPDLQDDDDDNLHEKVLAVYRALTESNRKIQQILVTLAPDAITSSTRRSISALVKMFPEARALLSFVHTTIKHSYLHVSNIKFHDSMNEKKQELQGLIQSNPPIFMMDCNLYDNRPVMQGITLNVSHDILLSAVRSKFKYSVLVLGKTQSGKSCLIEHIKQYADQNYSINQDVLGDGNTSRTQSTKRVYIDSNLPAFQAVENVTGKTVDIGNLETMLTDKDDYQDMLRSREKYFTLSAVPPNPDNPPSQHVEFTFLDTPGINDTNNRDATFAAKIIDEVIATRSFNLILVVVSCKHPLSMEYGHALEYYAKVLDGLHSNIVFLYTHVDYADCHPSNTEHHADMAKRHRAFSSIFQNLQYSPSWNPAGGSAAPEGNNACRYFTIDLQSTKRPIIQCLIRNTLRDILQLAILSPPAILDISNGNVDRIKAIVHPDAANQEFHERRRQEDRARQQEQHAGLIPQWHHGGREDLVELVDDGHLGNSAHMEALANSFLISEAPSSGRSASSSRP